MVVQFLEESIDSVSESKVIKRLIRMTSRALPMAGAWGVGGTRSSWTAVGLTEPPLTTRRARLPKHGGKGCRLASRDKLSEEVFAQEIGLIQSRQRWIAKQRERLHQELADVRRYSFDPENMELLRQRIGEDIKAASFRHHLLVDRNL